MTARKPKPYRLPRTSHRPRYTGPSMLVGRCFHTFKEAPDGCWVVSAQGHVDASMGHGLLLVTYFEWLLGDPMPSQFVTVTDLAAARAEFYSTADEMREAYEGHTTGLAHASYLHNERHEASKA